MTVDLCNLSLEFMTCACSCAPKCACAPLCPCIHLYDDDVLYHINGWFGVSMQLFDVLLHVLTELPTVDEAFVAPVLTRFNGRAEVLF